jgi:dCMP deaminase
MIDGPKLEARDKTSEAFRPSSHDAIDGYPLTPTTCQIKEDEPRYDAEPEEGTDGDFLPLPVIVSGKIVPGWDEYFMLFAQTASMRSTCIRRQVGAALVLDRRVIATGYNGTPRGARNCNDGGCERCASPHAMVGSGKALDECLCSHAEENTITQAAYHGVRVKGATLYSTLAPCLTCAKLAINAGIIRVVYMQPYDGADRAAGLMSSCGIQLHQFMKSR